MSRTTPPAEGQTLTGRARRREELGRERALSLQGVERLAWHEVRKVDHYWLGDNALAQPMHVREPETPCRGGRR